MAKKKVQEPVINRESMLRLEREVYLASFYDFFVEAFKVLNDGEYDDNWHIKYLCDRLQSEVERIIKRKKRKKHLIINIPPRSSKSKLVTEIFPVWAHLKKGTLDILTVSHSNGLAEGQSDVSRTLMSSDWFQDRFSLDLILQKDNNAKSFYKSTKGGSRLAFGITSKFLGRNADIVIADDLMDSDEAASEAYRQDVIEKFKKSLSTRLKNKSVGLIINVQQRLHPEDVTGWILDNLGEYYEHIKIPSEAKGPEDVSPPELYEFYRNGLFWDKPGRFSKEDLIMEKKSLGSKGYANMHLQKALDDDSGIFKRKWFNVISEAEAYQHFTNAGQKIVWNFFLDTAYTKEKRNDASAIVVAAYLNQKLYIREVRQVRKEFPDLVKWLKEYIPKYNSGSSRVYIEAKASGLSLIQQLRSEGGFNVLPLETGRDSKVSRAIQQTAFVEAGGVYLVKDEWNDDFLEQACSFIDGKSGHDDMVDAFVYSCKYRRSNNFYYGFA